MNIPKAVSGLTAPIFHSLGKPSTILAIQAPPSYPIFFNRPCLMSISYNENAPFNEVITSEVKLKTRFMWPSVYQKLVSAVPLSLVLSSAGRSGFFKTFHHLQLDGTSDWAIFEAIGAYTGPNLGIKTRFLPLRVSRRLAKLTGVKSTGFSRFHSYDFVSGRGQLAVIGKGEIVEIDIEAGHQMVVEKSHLVGIEINGMNDLTNIVSIQSFSDSVSSVASVASVSSVSSDSADSAELTNTASPAAPDNITFSSSASASNVKTLVTVPKTKLYFSNLLHSITSSFVAASASRLWNYVVAKLTKEPSCVAIHGPTKVLLQCGAAPLKINKDFGVPQASLPVKKQDMLSFVRIENGKAVFENTDKFV